MSTLPVPVVRAIAPHISKVRAYANAHKVQATIALLVVLGALYWGYRVFTAPSTAPRYVTTTVATSTVVATLSETGQVSASANVSVLSQSSGEVLTIPVAAGQHVSAGTALAYLDPTNAQQSVVSAKQALQSAQIALAKLTQPASVTTLTSAENSVASAAANLAQAHQTGYNDVSVAFLNLPPVISGLDTVLHGYVVPGRTSEQNQNAYSDIASLFDPTAVQYQVAAEAAYQTAYTTYTKSLADFKATPRSADDATIEALVAESYKTAASISDALKAANNLLNLVSTTLTSHSSTPPAILTSHIATLTGYTTTTNSAVASLSSDAANSTSASRALIAAQAVLDQTKTGADPLDIQSSELSVQMKQDALTVAEQNLADTVVRAPFSGTVAKLSVQQYQTIGTGAAVATLVSDNQSVAISVNEVDAAKLAVGEKATITFDALPNISIAGTLSSVDAIGTITSGVVSYNAVVTFDTPNAQVKPGMSATASIIIGTKTGLAVPQSAVKTASGQSYVLTFPTPLAGSTASTGAVSAVAPTRTVVTTGLSDTSSIIIESGLLAGDQVVTKTITGAAATVSSAAQSTSLFGAGGARSGATRAP